MIPSERIDQILKEILRTDISDEMAVQARAIAIMKYLDEQHSKHGEGR